MDANKIRKEAISSFLNAKLAEQNEGDRLYRAARNTADKVNDYFLKKRLASCSDFRVEIKTPDGKNLHYTLTGDVEKKARQQAENLVDELAHSYGYDRTAWKLNCDNRWTFQGALQKRQTFIDKILDFFFVAE